jgi:hypothetical protein
MSAQREESGDIVCCEGALDDEILRLLFASAYPWQSRSSPASLAPATPRTASLDSPAPDSSTASSTSRFLRGQLAERARCMSRIDASRVRALAPPAAERVRHTARRAPRRVPGGRSTPKASAARPTGRQPGLTWAAGLADVWGGERSLRERTLSGKSVELSSLTRKPCLSPPTCRHPNARSANFVVHTPGDAYL